MDMNQYKRARDFVKECHNSSERVVLTHGVFDLLHIGHLKTLNESRRKGDILIVGVDSDQMVKKLKGPSRPIIHELARLEVIANVKAVDFAFILEPDKLQIDNLYDYFLELYEYIGVDTITSGNPSEYSLDQQKICEKLNIQYELAGEDVVETTTDIVKKVKSL